MIIWSLTSFGNHRINDPIFQQAQGRAYRFLLSGRIHDPGCVQLMA